MDIDIIIKVEILPGSNRQKDRYVYVHIDMFKQIDIRMVTAMLTYLQTDRQAEKGQTIRQTD